ncbi:MAG: hypothetical protein KDC98_01960 [Planctomycetes bacterium]|nr:hypothetical protein [Planctomycetota bacterium]
MTDETESTVVDEPWRAAGFEFRRRLLVACVGDRELARALIHDAPLGLNFSFLENRIEVRVAAGGRDTERAALALVRAAAALVPPERWSIVPVCIARASLGVPTVRCVTPFRSYRRMAWGGVTALRRLQDDASARFARLFAREDRSRGQA